MMGRSHSHKKRRKLNQTFIHAPYQKLFCPACGEVYELSKILPASITIVSGVLEGFRKEHRYCEPRPAGKETEARLCEEWDDWMERNKEEREEWEKDTGRTWVRGAWKKELEERA